MHIDYHLEDARQKGVAHPSSCSSSPLPFQEGWQIPIIFPVRYFR